MSNPQMPQRIRFTHHWPADYKIYPANGAWGGVSGRGDVILHFFVERHSVPDEEIQKFNEDGSLAPVERKAVEEPQVARDMQVGILINREQAVNVAKWIIAKVEEYEKLISKGGEPKSESS